MESVVLHIKQTNSQFLAGGLAASSVSALFLQHLFGDYSGTQALAVAAVMLMLLQKIWIRSGDATAVLSVTKDSVSWKNGDSSEFVESEILHVNEITSAVLIITVQTPQKVRLVLACPLTMDISTDIQNKLGYRNLRGLRKHLVHRALI